MTRERISPMVPAREDFSLNELTANQKVKIV